MKNRIIGLIDLSEQSEKLIKLCYKFSKILSSEIILMHQVPGSVPSMADPQSRAHILQVEKDEALVELKEMASPVSGYDKVDYLVTEENLLAVIKKFDDGEYYNWVFSGLSRGGKFKQLFIKSTTPKIVENTNLLSIALPFNDEAIFLPKKLTVSLSPKFPLNKKEFDRMLKELSGQIRELEFISIVTNEDNETQTRNYLAELEKDYSEFQSHSKAFKGKEVFAELKKYMQDKPDSYLVLQQGSRALKDSLFRKYLLNELVYDASIPLIIIPE